MDRFTQEIERFNAVNDAICYWLGYQFKIGRERLIHEASLRYPIADTLTAKGTLINRVQLEKGHPLFSDRLIDVVIYNKNIQSIDRDDFDKSVHEIFELKLAKAATGTLYGTEHQRVVDDLLRLAYFNLIYKQDAYFLICGTYEDFKNYFIGDKSEIQITEDRWKLNERSQTGTASDEWDKSKSNFKDYFEFELHDNGGAKEFTFKSEPVKRNDDTDEKKRKSFGLKSFQKRYQIKDKSKLSWSKSLKIKTTCIAITPFQTPAPRTHACGIWKVEHAL